MGFESVWAFRMLLKIDGKKSIKNLKFLTIYGEFDMFLRQY